MNKSISDRKTKIELIDYLNLFPDATYTDIKAFLGVTSNQSVKDRLKRLEAEGWIKIKKGKKSGITVLNSVKRYELCGECRQLKEIKNNWGSV